MSRSRVGAAVDSQIRGANINVCMHYIDDLVPYEPLYMQLLGKWSSVHIIFKSIRGELLILSIVQVKAILQRCTCQYNNLAGK